MSDEQPRHIFLGRVNPERYNWTIMDHSDLVTADGLLKIRFSLRHSQLCIDVRGRFSGTALDLKNVVADLARSFVDSVGYASGAALTLDIVSYIDPDGEFSVLNSAFDGIRETEEIDNDAITLLVNSALTSSAVRSALADLREAILEPDRTGAACYRAIEAMRQLYVRGEDSGKGRARSWVSLRGVTGVPEADLRWLEQLAVPRRHGALMDVSSEERRRALRISRAVIDGYLQATRPLAPATDATPAEPQLPRT